MTGDLVRAIRACPQVVIAAVDGVCAGAGAILAMASDIRLGTAAARTAFLFTRVGLAGCDMGACAILPRLIGQGRAAELLITGRAMTAEEGLAWGFLAACCARTAARGGRGAGRRVRRGPDFRARDDQEHAQSGMEHERRPGPRGGGSGAGDLHADARTSSARSRPLRRATSRSSSADEPRAPDYHDELLALPFFERSAPRRRGRRLNAWAAGAALDSPSHRGRSQDAVDARCRDLVAPLGAAGLTRYCVPAEVRGRAAGFRRTLHLPHPRNACVLRRARRFRVRDAGARERCDLARRQPLAASALPADGRAGRGDRRLCAIRAAGRIGCRGDDLPRRARGRALRSRRREDLDFEWRHRGFLLRLRAHRPGPRRARRHHRCATASAPSWSRLPIRVFPSSGASTSMRRIRSRSSPSAAAEFRRARSSGRRARASRLRCARSTCSAPRWRPRRPGSRAAPSTRRSPTRRRAPDVRQVRWRIFS